MSAYADVTEMPEQAPEPEDDATLMYTSGSTATLRALHRAISTSSAR